MGVDCRLIIQDETIFFSYIIAKDPWYFLIYWNLIYIYIYW